MEKQAKQMISIWLFIGVLVIVYGFLILGVGMYEFFVPPVKPVVLAELHAGVWWGSLMLILGGIFVGKNATW